MARKPRGDSSEGEGTPAENRKRGAGFKFSMLDALLLEDRANNADHKVAYAIIQHMNSQTGACFPSIEKIAAKVNLEQRYVRQRIKHLREIGFLLVTRGNRQLSNSYDFNPAFMDILGREKEILKRRLAKRKPRSCAAEGNNSSYQANPQSGPVAPPARGSMAPPNTVMEHLKRDAG